MPRNVFQMIPHRLGERKMAPNPLDEIETSPQASGDFSASSAPVHGQPDQHKVELATFEQGLQEQVFNLYAEVFGAAASSAFRARWRWAQQENLYPQDTYKWVLLDRNRVVGFLATIPLSYSIKGATLLAHTPCDYMVHFSYRFYGIKMMREFFRATENCVTCDDVTATIKVTQWLGAKQAGMFFRYVKILDGRSLGLHEGWERVPSVLWSPVTRTVRLVDRLRWGVMGKRDTVRPIDEFDQRFDRFYHRLSHSVPITVTRDVGFLQWRYGSDSPHAGRGIGVVTEGDGELIGYVIFFLSGGPSYIGYILDLQVLPMDNTEVAMALLSYAVEQLRRNGAWSVRYYHLASPFTIPDRLLRWYGFIRRGAHRLMVRFRDNQWAAIAENQNNWNYSYGDSEASHASK